VFGVPAYKDYLCNKELHIKRIYTLAKRGRTPAGKEGGPPQVRRAYKVSLSLFI